MKRDCALDNIALQFDLHVQEKHFLEFEHRILYLNRRHPVVFEYSQ